jgi:hypothetical protein
MILNLSLEKRKYLRKCYRLKCRENDEEENIEPNG